MGEPDATGPPYREPSRGATVLGAPLEPGERVLYAHRRDYSAARLGTGIGAALAVVPGLLAFTSVLGPDVVMGSVLTGLAALVGAYAVFLEKLVSRGVAVTDRRVILIGRGGAPRQMLLADVGDVQAVRQVGHSTVPGIALDAIRNYEAGTHPRADPEYWERTTGIVLVSMTSKLRVSAGDASQLGPFLVRWAFEPGFAAEAPEVAFEP